MALARAFVRFAVVGAAATAIHAAVFALIVETTRIDPVVATGAAFSVAFVAGFVLNRRWTFASRASPVGQLPRYLAAQLAGLALSAAIMYAAVHLQRWSPYAGLALSIALVPPVTFALSRWWVFRRPREPQRDGAL
ncbi:MAG: GtrA family protein [Burkholderiales bacterium]|jgi:putative flippase GtrA|nr:GtrA family protein [Burkholderiales bacterium]